LLTKKEGGKRRREEKKGVREGREKEG